MLIFSKKLLGFSLLALSLNPFRSQAQKIDTISTFSINGYVDAYYASYTDSAGPGNFQKFPSTSPRSNQPSLNTAMLSFLYNADKVRATAVFHYGDIPAATWSPNYPNIAEAHVGFKVQSKLWIDAGFFRTHFGTEYLLPVENLASSVTVATFHEPYYESGFRLNFDPTKKLEINLFLLTGYNMLVDNNEKKSFGMGVTYALGDNGGIGYTNYIGEDSPPGTAQPHLRIHQNAFINYAYKKLKMQAGADYCMQQNSDIATGTQYAGMYTALATFKYQCATKAALYVRGETFQDPEGYMGAQFTDITGKKTGYKLYGGTAGAEFKPTDDSYVRLEGRMLQMDNDQKIFYYNGVATATRYEIMINAGISFELLKSYRTRRND